MPWEISGSFVIVETQFALVATITPILAENYGRVGVVFSVNSGGFLVSFTTDRAAVADKGITLDNRIIKTHTMTFRDLGPLVCKKWFAFAAAPIDITVFEVILAKNPDNGQVFYTGNIALD